MSDSATGPKIVPLGVSNLNDIAASMEIVAKAIRDGKHGALESAACVLLKDNGEPVIFGWGKTHDIHSMGLLTLGASWLASAKWERQA